MCIPQLRFSTCARKTLKIKVEIKTPMAAETKKRTTDQVYTKNMFNVCINTIIHSSIECIK